MEKTSIKETASICFDAMAKFAIKTAVIEFDGCGDSGQIESNSLEEPAASHPVLVKLEFREWTQDGMHQRIEPVTKPLAEVMELLVYRLLEHKHSGWEDNDGAFGTFTFDSEARTVSMEFNERRTEYDTTTETF